MIDVEKYKLRLKKRLHELDDRLEEAEETLQQEHEKDWEDDATVHEQDEVLEDLSEMDAKEVKAIFAALGRIELGTYGKCVSCGAEISEERLDLLPQTPFCKDCAPE